MRVRLLQRGCNAHCGSNRSSPSQIRPNSSLSCLAASVPASPRQWNPTRLNHRLEAPTGVGWSAGRCAIWWLPTTDGLGESASAAPLSYLEDRDEWIGWNVSQRMEHLPRVLKMNRFLIRPRVHCQNLASRVLGLCARPVAEDFQRRYGLGPWLLESFGDRSR